MLELQAMAQPQPVRDFLEGEFLTLSINGALQHSSTYATECEKDRETVRLKLRCVLRDLAKKYGSGVGEEEHLENIQELSRRVEKDCAEFLNGDHLPLGVAQKALNLYLKYLWCEDEIPTPPHCPFDSKIIAKLTVPTGCECRWTQVVNVEHYREWVLAAKKEADKEAKKEGKEGFSLADWELRAWNAAQPGGKAGCSQGKLP